MPTSANLGITGAKFLGAMLTKTVPKPIQAASSKVHLPRITATLHAARQIVIQARRKSRRGQIPHPRSPRQDARTTPQEKRPTRFIRAALARANSTVILWMPPFTPVFRHQSLGSTKICLQSRSMGLPASHGTNLQILRGIAIAPWAPTGATGILTGARLHGVMWTATALLQIQAASSKARLLLITATTHA
jgi:hypothetical protein